MMQETFDLLQISDIEHKIQRLETRNNDILENLVIAKQLFSTTDVKSTDVISRLNQQIAEEALKIIEYTKRSDMIRKWILDEKQDHFRRVEKLNEKYIRKRISLLSKLKASNTKINTLEQYKDMRINLQEKLVSNSDAMSQVEQNLILTLDQVDRKDKSNARILKQEMYCQLLDTSTMFQKEMKKNEIVPICKLMRENIALVNDISPFSKYDQMHSRIGKRKEDDQRKFHEKLASSSINQHLVTSKLQNLLIKEFKGKLKAFAMNKDLTDPNMTYDYIQNEYSIKLSKEEKNINKTVLNINCRKVMLFQEQLKYDAIKLMSYKMKYILKTHALILNALKSTIKRLLKTRHQDKMETINIYELLLYFLNLLTTENLTTLHNVQNETSIEDFGFIPVDTSFDFIET